MRRSGENVEFIVIPGSVTFSEVSIHEFRWKKSVSRV
jgi:hypothetical protein